MALNIGNQSTGGLQPDRRCSHPPPSNNGVCFTMLNSQKGVALLNFLTLLSLNPCRLRNTLPHPPLGHGSCWGGEASLGDHPRVVISSPLLQVLPAAAWLSEASFQQQQILSWHQLILWHQSFHSLTRHVMVFPCHVFSVQNQALTFIFLLRPHGCSFPTHCFYPDPEFGGLLRTIAFDQRFFFNGWLHI